MICHNLILCFIIQFLYMNTKGKILNTKDSGVSCSDVKLIVDTHNTMRLKVAKGTLPGQPKASNMQMIVWDDKLQALAQQWANNMQFSHNPNRKDSRWSVGENLYTSWSTDINSKSSNWNTAISEWYNEYKYYKYQKTISDPKTGHYTQLIWHNTMYVGCGYSTYMKNKHLHKLYVCNYGPTGNYLNQYPYSTGNGCEQLCCTTQCDGNKKYGQKC